jgi:hypothetical protein
MRTLIKEDARKNNYLEFVIDVHLFRQKWAVNRKFKDFLELHNILNTLFASLALPDCKAARTPLNSAENGANMVEMV